MVKKNRAAEILEKLREHGHELLQQSCGDGARHTPATLGQWID
jgi:hypothetical protein